MMEQSAELHLRSVPKMRAPTVELQWSEELAYSAGKFVEEYVGCPIYPPLVVNDTHEHTYLKQVASSFRDHRRVVLVPEMWAWEDTDDIVYHLYTSLSERMDGGYYYPYTKIALESDLFDSIGVACNCHSRFGEWCAVEFGKEIVPLGKLYHDTHWPAGNFSFDHERLETLYITPEFALDTWEECPADSRKGYCGLPEVVHELDVDVSTNGLFEPWSGESTNNVRDFVTDFYDAVTGLRENKTAAMTSFRDLYVKKYLDYFIQEPGYYEEYKWNLNLQSALQRVLNSEGPCGTSGDIFGNSLGEVLKRYYMLEYEGLEVLKFQVPGLNPASGEHPFNATETLEYLLGQDCINTDLLLHKKSHQWAMACSCTNIPLNVESAGSYTTVHKAATVCYVATVRHALNKVVVENLPHINEIAYNTGGPTVDDGLCSEQCE
jgi:hypothetical protein